MLSGDLLPLEFKASAFSADEILMNSALRSKVLLLGTLLAVAFGLPLVPHEPGQPRSSRLPAAEEFELMHWLTTFRQQVQAGLDRESCASTLGAQYEELARLTPDSSSAVELRARADEATQGLFLARQDLRDALYRLYRIGGLEEPCVDQARNVMRVLRYAEEFIAEHWVRPAPYDEKTRYPYLSGERPYLQTAAGTNGFRPSDLQSGDLILSRGNAFASAAIARLSSVQGQFSHAAFIYVEPASRQVLVLEAHIELGSTIRSYEEYSAAGNFRAMVVRARDPELRAVAERAAGLAYERLRAAQQSPQKAVPYDFAMDLSDDREYFCTEIPFDAFKKASGGAVQVPLFLGRVEPRNRDFVDRLGIRATRSFLPSDMDVDPRFEVLAEWRDLSRVATNQRKDAVLDRFFAWSDEHGYQLEGNLSSWFKKSVIWRLRRWPLFSRLLQKKFPLNMSQNVLEVISVLGDLGETLEEELERADRAALERRGFRMTIAEMEAHLDSFRLKDLERYRRWREWRRRHPGGGRGASGAPRAPKIHHVFRPSKSS